MKTSQLRSTPTVLALVSVWVVVSVIVFMLPQAAQSDDLMTTSSYYDETPTLSLSSTTGSPTDPSSPATFTPPFSRSISRLANGLELFRITDVLGNILLEGVSNPDGSILTSGDGDSSPPPDAKAPSLCDDGAAPAINEEITGNDLRLFNAAIVYQSVTGGARARITFGEDFGRIVVEDHPLNDTRCGIRTINVEILARRRSTFSVRPYCDTEFWVFGQGEPREKPTTVIDLGAGDTAYILVNSVDCSLPEGYENWEALRIDFDGTTVTYRVEPVT